MFLGTYTPRLDDKGRIALPARFRPELEGGLVICKGQDRCLYVFPVTEFGVIANTLAGAALGNGTEVVSDLSTGIFISSSLQLEKGSGRRRASRSPAARSA